MTPAGQLQIDGMLVAKYVMRNGGILWQSIRQPPPIESTSFNKETGETVTVIVHGDREIIWSGAMDPDATRAQHAHVRFRSFHGYEPDPEHDEFERLLQVSDWFAAKFAAQFKIKPREPIGSLPLGNTQISFSCGKAGCHDERARELLRWHANGHWGEHGCLADYLELTEEQEWCPVFFGVGTMNAVAIRSNSGFVRSAYTERGFDGRHREMIDIVTFLGSHNETMIVSRRHDI
jgi:hypothetical protein